MSAYIEQVDAYVDELNAIRDAVAALAREERDRTSHRAYLMQARTLRDMLGKASSLYSAAGAQAQRECISDEATVVHYYMEMLSDYSSTTKRESRPTSRRARTRSSGCSRGGITS